MASSPKVSSTTDKVDYTLREIGATLSDLDSVLDDQQSGDLSDDERITLSLEWDREVHHLHRILDPAYRSGQMTPEQAARYRELLGALRVALPIIDKLGFARPSVPLDV